MKKILRIILDLILITLFILLFIAVIFLHGLTKEQKEEARQKEIAARPICGELIINQEKYHIVRNENGDYSKVYEGSRLKN